jgi:hypothetical protein
VVCIVFIGLGWGFINNANHTPFIPVNEGEALLSSGRCLFLTSSVATILVIMVGVVF